jgi:Fe2+ transport system protein FeoA
MSSTPLLTVNRLLLNWRARIVGLRANGALRARLVQRGIMPGIVIVKVREGRRGRGGDIRMKDRELTLTAREADAVLVELLGVRQDP